MAIIDANVTSFKKDVLENERLVFVDFYASWCGPCKMVAPIIHDLSEEDLYKGKIDFVKIDVDTCVDIASSYNIFSIPTFHIFHKGKVILQFVGAHDKKGFEEKIQQALATIKES